MTKYLVTADTSTSYWKWEGEAESPEEAEELFWEERTLVDKGSDYGAEVYAVPER